MEKRVSDREDLLSKKVLRAVLQESFTLGSFFYVDRIRERACSRGRMEVAPVVGRNTQRHQVRALFCLVGLLFVGTPRAAGVASRPLPAAPRTSPPCPATCVTAAWRGEDLGSPSATASNPCVIIAFW